MLNVKHSRGRCVSPWVWLFWYSARCFQTEWHLLGILEDCKMPGHKSLLQPQDWPKSSHLHDEKRGCLSANLLLRFPVGLDTFLVNKLADFQLLHPLVVTISSMWTHSASTHDHRISEQFARSDIPDKNFTKLSSFSLAHKAVRKHLIFIIFYHYQSCLDIKSSINNGQSVHCLS